MHVQANPLNTSTLNSETIVILLVTMTPTHLTHLIACEAMLRFELMGFVTSPAMQETTVSSVLNGENELSSFP